MEKNKIAYHKGTSVLINQNKSSKRAHDIKIGLFLAIRQLKHASIWTTGLIVIVMMLTFLNLVVVNGILVGLIESSIQASEERYSGNVIISTLRQKSIICELF